MFRYPRLSRVAKALFLLFLLSTFCLFMLLGEEDQVSEKGSRAWSSEQDKLPAEKYTPQNGERLNVGVGMGITCRGMTKLAKEEALKVIPFFYSLLPSFCRTASLGYHYSFFIAYDYNDPLLTDAKFLDLFEKFFQKQTNSSCPKGSQYSIHFIKCTHSGNPAWAQNDAAVAAYLWGADYFYRVNDDTTMETQRWTEIFIRSLDQTSPPRVGVVGPKHQNGNLKVLTYDFTHRTHIEILGFHYPRSLKDWGADVWITNIYFPGRTKKHYNVSLVHTQEQGRRYKVKDIRWENTRRNIEHYKNIVTQYVKKWERGFPKADPKFVVSMNLCGNSSTSAWGLIRNAQLMPLVYPGWTMRVYVPDENVTSSPLNNSIVFSPQVRRVLTTLGVTLKPTTLDVKCSGHLVADDPDVDVFLIRNADERLCERDAAAVQDWLNQTSGDQFVHVVKDHPHLKDKRLVNGQWGAKTKPLRMKLGQSMESLLKSVGKHRDCDTWLEKELLLKIDDNIFCHDSIYCMSGSKCRPLPGRRGDKRFVGQKYDNNELVNQSDIVSVLSSRLPECNMEYGSLR